mgnify:FL=1
MKECPKCHKHYDDSMNFCTDCGVALNKVSNQVAVSQSCTSSNRTTETSTVRSRKGGCLKKVIICIAVLAVAFVGFIHYVNNAATYLRVEPNQLVASKGGGKIKVDVDYDGYVWTINHTPDWIDIDENENSFEVSVGKNLTGSRREGTITVQSGKLLAQVAIVQSGVATVVRGSKSNLKFGKSGGSQTVSVETDGCELSAECSDFIQTSFSDDGDLIVRVSSNSDDYRTGQVRVYEDNQSWTITVEQAGKCNICRGTGEISCTWCSGTGTVGYGMFMSSCMSCGGSGSYKCSSCNGKGEKE